MAQIPNKIPYSCNNDKPKLIWGYRETSLGNLELHQEFLKPRES